MKTSPRTARLTRCSVALGLTALLIAGCGSAGDTGGPDDGLTTDGRSDRAASSAGVVTTVDPQTGLTVPAGRTRFFSAGSPWNTRVDDDQVDPGSETLLERAKDRIGVVETAGSDQIETEFRTIEDGIYINTESWTVPVVAGGVETDVVCRQAQCGDGDDTLVLQIPDDVDPDPRYDGWFTIFDLEEGLAYDLWRARREADQSISYHFMRTWDLEDRGFLEPQEVSARGSGLPLFAGLIRPEELANGLIDHALAISVPGPAPGIFVRPASSTDGNGRPGSIPEGARIRLRADYVPSPPRDPVTGELIRLDRRQRITRDAIVVALRTYGAIVVDRAAVPTLYAQRDVTSGLLDGHELQSLQLTDFEVVELGTRYSYPPGAGTDESGRITRGQAGSPSTPAIAVGQDDNEEDR